MKKLAFIITTLFIGFAPYAGAQIPDTTGIYGEKKDSLEAAVFISRQDGNYLSKGKEIRTEVISAAGLCKMACCNLSESFENSASVTVGYADAVTGARQIRLLGQNGIYTQMLDENRPIMRGLSAPFGLNYVPGQWLESIQIAKGMTSVINGVESMTGQINLEHRKPTDEKPLYIQASAMADTKCDLNIISSLQLDEMSKWSTVILAHIDGNFKSADANGDGFMDDPRQLQFNFANRWLYYGTDGTQVRFGVRAIRDSRLGGQMDAFGDSRWKADILSSNLNAYVKLGVPLNEDGTRSFAVVADYTYQAMDSFYGIGDRSYNAGQNTAFANVLYQDNSNENNMFTVGFSNSFDSFDELAFGTKATARLNDFGAFGEYTFHSGDVFSLIAGLRGDWYNHGGLKLSPRLTLKYTPDESIIFRANGGRGIRYSVPLVDNFGVLASSKSLTGNYISHPLEESWTFGGNATWYMPFDKSGKTWLSFDYFGSIFTNQVLIEYTNSEIQFSELANRPEAYSHTHNFQLDFSTEPVRGLTVTLTGRYTDARQLLSCQSDDVKPMTSRYKGVLNLQYATRLNKWIFDFTASVNGPCRVWDFMSDYKNGYSPVFPMLYAQVTRRFKGWDIYVGGENLTNYRQSNPILGYDAPFGPRFDASCVWGPVSGIKVYAGFRFTLWK